MNMGTSNAEEIVFEESSSEDEQELTSTSARTNSKPNYTKHYNPHYYEYQRLRNEGSKFMNPDELRFLYNQTTNIKYENDPYSEMYYHIKIKEREGASIEASRVNPFLSSNQKEVIKNMNITRTIQAKNFTKLNQSLGTVTKHNYRSQTPQLDLSDLNLEDESNSNAAHIRILSSIESGFSALLKIEQTNARIAQCINPFSLLVLKKDLDAANQQLLQAFFIEPKENGYDIKWKWLIRLMSIRKGKKLLLNACPVFTQPQWLLLLSYILPYILIWSDDEMQKDIDMLVFEMMKEFLVSPAVDLPFVTSILEMFIKLKTVSILPALLNTEPYSEIMDTLINRGEELANAVGNEEDEEYVKWTEIINLLQQLINEQNEESEM